MKRLATLLILLSVISSGAAYGNSFLNQFAGKWNVTEIISGEGQSKRITHTFELKKLKSGHYRAISRSHGMITGESFFYKNGNLKILFYEENPAGEGSGKWSISKGRLLINYKGKSVSSYKSISASMNIKRLNNNTYTGIGTGRFDNFKLSYTSTYRRIR